MSTRPSEPTSATGVGARGGALAELLEYATATAGKGLRSRLLIEADLAARGAEGAPDPRVETCAVAIEMAHLATLVHDDVADAGLLRRGQLSLPAFFGATKAAGAGGALFGQAFGLFASCGVDVVRTAASAAAEICEGQMLELRSLYDTGRTRAAYFDVISGKTAALFRLASQLGGILGRANKLELSVFAHYGESLGIAHQIIDDILDLVGLPEQTGKERGKDIRNGIYTLPVIYALEDRPHIRRLLETRAPVEIVVEEVLETRGVAQASSEVRGIIDKAKGALDGLSRSNALLRMADARLAALERVT